MQVPGGEVGIQKRGVERSGLESIQQCFARLEASHHVVVLREGHRAGHDPDPSCREGRPANGTPSDFARDHQAKLGAGIGNAPGRDARGGPDP